MIMIDELIHKSRDDNDRWMDGRIDGWMEG